MRRLLIISIVLLPFYTLSQNTFSSLDSTVASFYKALEVGDDDERLTNVGVLFKPKAQINAITTSELAPPTYATGDVEAFYNNTKSFYSEYQFAYDEVDRDLNYYSNLASINSYVFQRLKKRDEAKSYEQFLWFSIDLVYEYNRWWIVSASWINETERSSIRNVMQEDTLWHTLSP